MAKMQGEEELAKLLEGWPPELEPLHRALTRLKETALAQIGSQGEFVERPGVSHSLRFHLEPRPEGRRRPVFFLVDVISAADETFLSVCFYQDEVDDPRELGNAIPQGLFQETGYCFDVDADNAGDEELMSYLEERISQAKESAAG
jgi:hypothetical protein